MHAVLYYFSISVGMKILKPKIFGKTVEENILYDIKDMFFVVFCLVTNCYVQWELSS